LSANLELTQDLLLRALLASVSKNSDVATRFIKLIYENPKVNKSVADISRTFIKKFPHKSHEDLSCEFWNLKYLDQSNDSILSYINKFENLAQNLQFDVNSNITIDFLRRSVPDWVQDKLKLMNFNQSWDNDDESEVVNFEIITNAIQSIYNNFKLTHSTQKSNISINQLDKDRKSKDNNITSNHESSKNLTVVRNQIWCSYCQKANHSEDQCFTKFPELRPDSRKNFFGNTNPRPPRLH
jgi:hypothetical protein